MKESHSTKPPVILVCGGSRGIGAATVKLAAKRGYDVCFSYHSQESTAAEVVAEVQQMGRRAVTAKADFANEDEIKNLWAAAIEYFGNVDALVNNVGILKQQSKLVDFDVERLESVFRVNVIGSILCAREAVRHMSTSRGGKGGVIVNISSIAARLGAANEYIDYAASKAAIDTLTVGLAKEVAAEGIRVAGVRPGSTYTDIHASGGEPNRVDRVAKMVPMKRGGYPDEIAEAIVWLTTPSASYVSGAILDVAGGL